VTRAAFPYRRATSATVRADVWMLVEGDSPHEAPPYLDGWDYNTELHLRRELQVDTPALREEASLQDHVHVSVAVSAFSSSTWLRRKVFERVLDGSQDVTIDFSLAGEELGGNLRLHTVVLLDDPGNDETEFAAHLPGSILWNDKYEIRLQGDAPLFPISVVDFDAAGFPQGAGWHLDVGSDLEAPLHAAIRLYLNRADPVVVGAFARAAAPSPEDIPVLRAVYADVARVMVEHALNQDALRSGNEWNIDSLGFALERLLGRYFPNADLNAVLAQRIEHPSDFSTELFGQLQVFGG
jgi:hypothetical protein